MEIEKIKAEIESIETFPESPIVSSIVDRILKLEPVSISESKMAFDCLWELFVKLSENYDGFNCEQSAQIIKLAEKNWSVEDIDYLECLLAVVLNCDCNLALDLLQIKSIEATTKKSKKMIEEAIEELLEYIHGNK